jgi:outer membrane protein OmpA-like peptidoglycan-associated protein
MGMGDQDDGARNLALLVLAGVLAMVLAATVVLAAATAARHRSSAAPERPPVAARTAYGPVETLYFALESAKLNAAATEALQRLVQTARANPRAGVFVVATQPQAVEAQTNPYLASQRALAVRHALEGQGIAPDRITVMRPAEPAGRDDARRTRRVEVRLE